MDIGQGSPFIMNLPVELPNYIKLDHTTLKTGLDKWANQQFVRSHSRRASHGSSSQSRGKLSQRLRYRQPSAGAVAAVPSRSMEKTQSENGLYIYIYVYREEYADRAPYRMFVRIVIHAAPALK